MVSAGESRWTRGSRSTGRQYAEHLAASEGKGEGDACSPDDGTGEQDRDRAA